MENDNTYHPYCGICLCFWKESIFPSLNRAGVEDLIFNAFYIDHEDATIGDDIGPWTLEALVVEIQKYMNVRYILLKSNAKSDLDPSDIKKVVFIFLVASILKINYHHGQKL